MNLAYLLLMSTAVATGLLLSRFTQQVLPIGRGQKLGLAVGAFCGAMIGAKLPFVLADWPGLLSGEAWFLPPALTVVDCGSPNTLQWQLPIRRPPSTRLLS